MLAVFTDLDQEDQADFRPWLVEDMFPPRMEIGFIAGASFDLLHGDGQEFVTLYEMPSLGHLYGEPYQGLRRVREPKDAAYHEKFRGADRYTLAWAGPELSSDAGGFAPFIHVDRFGLAAHGAQDFNIWFACDYLPSLAGVPGLTRVRRYLAMEGAPLHLVFSEFNDAAALENSNWTDHRQKFGTAVSGLYQRIVEA